MIIQIDEIRLVGNVFTGSGEVACFYLDLWRAVSLFI